MKLSEVEKLKEAYERIRVLDGEIVEIEKMAMLIAEKKTEVVASFTVTDVEEKIKKKVKFDSNGSLISGENSGGQRFILSYLGDMMKDRQEEDDSSAVRIVSAISDTTALRLLGELYASKDAERKEILKYFREIGVKA